MPVEAAFKLPFQEQIDFFRGKVNIPTRRWNDLWKEQHAKGFMIAGAMRDDMLADFRDAVDKAISEGTTLAQFRGDFDKIVSKYGWSYHGLRNWRSEIIYDTNIRTSYMAGRYKQMTDPDVLAYQGLWEYGHTTSENPRPEHLVWVGTVLPHDDPWWNTHYPPNGWRCKCRVIPRSEGDMKRLDKTVSKKAPSSPIDGATGEPVGIDRGWGYNVGKAAWGEGETRLIGEEKGKWRDLVPWGVSKYGRPEKMPTEAFVARPVPKPEPGGIAVLSDPRGELVNAVGAQDFGKEFSESFSDLIEDPYEIWINFVENDLSGRVALRRRYVKSVRRAKGAFFDLWAEIQDGCLVAGHITGAERLRKGKLIYGR